REVMLFRVGTARSWRLLEKTIPVGFVEIGPQRFGSLGPGRTGGAVTVRSTRPEGTSFNCTVKPPSLPTASTSPSGERPATVSKVIRRGEACGPVGGSETDVP